MQRLSSTAWGSRTFGSCGTKRLVRSAERSPLIKARGILLSHDRYDVNGHLHRNRRSCRVSHGDYDAFTWEPGTFTAEVLVHLLQSVPRSVHLCLTNSLPH